AETGLYDYSPGESFPIWKSISNDVWESDHHQPTDWWAVEHIYNGDGLPCLVDITNKYHIAGNAILGYLGLDYAGTVETINAEWLMDEAVARLAGNYDILMNARSWYDAARAIDGWASNFWTLYRNLRRNPRRAWGSFRRFAKRFFHRSIHKAPEELVRGLPATAREYCAIKYGALPIIHDLRDTLKRVQRPKSTVRVVATASAKASPVLVDGINSDVYKTWRFTDSCSAIAVRYLSTDSIESYSNFGDLVQTPLYTAWDAIPWSFVIDWFLPVGNVLLQVQPFGFNVTRGFDCFRYRGHNVLQVSDGALVNYGCNGAKVREFQRRVNTSMALGLEKAISHYITNNRQLSYVRQVGHHLIDLYALGRSRLH
ncbi:maturation protein, partial [ssRNA phage AVE019]